MSARDDYPRLTGPDADRAIAEICALRMDVVKLLHRLQRAETMMRIASDPNASIWQATTPKGSA